MGRRLQYVATEKDPLYLHALGNRFLRTPNVAVVKLDPENPGDYQDSGGPFQTLLCINVLEHVEDPDQVVASCAGVIEPGGSLIVLAPQGRKMGSLDRTLGHKRRFTKKQLRALLTNHGFAVDRLYQLNKIGAPAWWLYSRVLRARHINKVTLKLFDKTVWLWKRIEGALPWKGLSVVAVAKKK
jgi:SAM-dependent methyltransferase